VNERPDDRAGSVVARVGGGVVLLGLSIWILRPFLVPLLWAGILAYATWPIYRFVREHTRRPRLAAGLFTLAMALLVGVPVAWILVALAGEASHLIDVARAWVEAGAPLPAWVMERPWLATRLEGLRTESVVQPREVAEYATRYASQVSGQLLNVAGGLASNAFKFALTVVTLFFFYVDGERIAEQLGKLMRVVFPQSRDEMLPYVGSVVRAVVFGLLGTALVQGLLAGIGLALFGVPAPVALGALTALASFVPMGPVFIWGGAALWLLAGGHLGAAIGMAIWGAGLVSTIDNVLRPILISGSGATKIPFLLVVFGVLGGLLGFGMLGLFLGPVVLAVAFALVSDFARRADAVSRTRSAG
jgi:predicted PurR-regulated permease PerM